MLKVRTEYLTTNLQEKSIDALSQEKDVNIFTKEPETTTEPSSGLRKSLLVFGICC